MQYWFTLQPNLAIGLMPEYPGVWAFKPTILECFRELQLTFGDYVLFKSLAGLSITPITPRADSHDYYLDLRYSSAYNCYIVQDLVYSSYQIRAQDAETAILKYFQGCTIIPLV